MAYFHDLPDGARMAYDDAGSGRPVVLIHGVSMSRRFFERNIEPLAERFHVINVDLRGHGESPAHEAGTPFRSMLATSGTCSRRSAWTAPCS